MATLTARRDAVRRWRGVGETRHEEAKRTVVGIGVALDPDPDTGTYPEKGVGRRFGP